MRTWIVACAAAALLWPGGSRAASPAPEEMAQRVATSLRESGELSNYRVGVKYEDGVAWLLGSVTSDEQSETAARVASGVEGVSHVVNKLEVKPQAEKAQATKVAKADKASPDLLLATLQEEPAELPPMPTAMPAPQGGAKGLPRPMQRVAMAPADQGGYAPQGYGPQGQVAPAQYGAGGAMPIPQGYSTGGAAGVNYDNANMPNYAWPSYAAHPNYAALSYPQQYSPSAWPYIGPFYPYPQVPLGWRKVTLEWDDGWWYLDFSHHKGH
ncbi:MAG: BON domain-containing protein [Lacipirellulaceae bacterium]